MKVDVLYRNDPERKLMDPVLEPGGRPFVFRLYRGDLLDPQGDPDGWFLPVLPERVVRGWLRFAPFVAFKWPFLNRALYIGYKLYGVDAPEYVSWAGRENVYEGSVAMCFSFRPFANMEKG